jgi:hypothetical protein
MAENRPDGMWHFAGRGRDGGGERAWSVVVKTIGRPEADHSEPYRLGNRKREYLLARSGPAAELPGKVRAPRFYREEDLYLRWLPLLHHALKCADEARALMGQVSL